MKVLHIITGNDNGGGGAHVLNICKYSKSFQNILGCVGEGYLYERAMEEKVSTVLFENIINNVDIINYIEENEIDIVNFHGAKAFLIHRFIKGKIKVPTLASVHSDYRYDFLNSRIKHILFTPLSKFGLKSFEYYMCISEYIKEVLEENHLLGEKCIVNNGIDKENTNITKSKNEIRNQYNIHENEFVFTITARLHPVKNHSGLIHAFKKLRNEFNDIKLILVGEGEIGEELKKKVLELGLVEDVIFTGFVENPIDIVNASDISILTSLNEGGSPPMVVLESALAKVPVISTKVGDMEKLFTDEMIFLIENNNEEEIYKKMKEAYLKRDSLEEMGNGLHEEVISNYHMKRFCETYYSFYKKIINNNSNSGV